ncbi:MAG: mechanosensitive ion channel [Muribaculaceae bacterium]|nr:mechanosensitive ion channel [Muribaculaceae bacterium]
MTNLPPYRIAHVIIEFIDSVLKKCGIQHNETIDEFIYILIVIGIAYGIGWSISKIAVLITNKMRWFKRVSLSSAVQAEKTLLKVSKIIPPLIFLSLIQFAFNSESIVLSAIIKIAAIYLIITIVSAINDFLGFLWRRYDEIGNTQNHPLKGLPQIAKGAVWLIGIIIMVSVIVNKSPLALFTGLGAFAAVVMLVFKDSILGLVAGIQLSQNDMLRVGDWIIVPGTPANGIVADVSLTVVKVRNWDNTLAMLPPYTLVSASFQNWRTMYESGHRQINRSYNISSTSIHSPSDALLESLKNIPLLRDYINKKQAQSKAGIIENTRNTQGIVNGTIDTNLGIFRAYLTLYLQHHPFIAQDAFLLVNELAPTAQGIPIRIYCYTTFTDWVSHESVQSEIFEHIALMAPVFELEIFQFPNHIYY